MKYIAAYALLVLGGKASPSAADVEKVLKEAGLKSDSEHVERLISSLKDKPFHEYVKAGSAKFASMGSVAASAPAAGGAAPVQAKAEAKEEKPKEEDVDVGGMGDLFGGDY